MKHQFKIGDKVIFAWLGAPTKGTVEQLTWYPPSHGVADQTIKVDSNQVPSYKIRGIDGGVYPHAGLIETIDIASSATEEAPTKKKKKKEETSPLQMKFCNIILDRTNAL